MVQDETLNLVVSATINEQEYLSWAVFFSDSNHDAVTQYSCACGKHFLDKF